MRSVYDLKPKFQGALRPLVDWLAARGVTANQVTVAAAVLSFAAGTMIARAHGGRMLLLLPAALLVRMALNAMDGMLAREHGQKSALGGILNELGDIVADIALYIPLVAVRQFVPAQVVMVVIFAILTEMAGVAGMGSGSTRRYDGPMGKSDRAFWFGLMGLLLGLGMRVEAYVPAVMLGMVVLMMVTIFNRVRGAVREASGAGAVL